MGHHSQHHHNTSDGVSQRVNSPRFSGPMTRRAHSFKRNPNSTHNNCNNTTNSVAAGYSTNYEIDLQLGSTRSGNSVSIDGFDRQSHHATQRLHGDVMKSFRKKPIRSVVLDLRLREKKQLGHWMFFVFCGMCLFVGVLKICATGWFGSVLEKGGFNQVGYVYVHMQS